MSSINRRQFLTKSGALAFALKWGSAFAEADTSVDASGSPITVEGWSHPPRGAKPWVFWYWMNGLVTREGITADLQSMHDAGIGGAYLMTIGKDSPLMASPVTPASAKFWRMAEFASLEGVRLDVDLAMSACDGWATAGGPWISPELSMQKVVWSALQTHGGHELDVELPHPPLFLGSFQDAGGRPLPPDHRHYRELAVLAFPSPGGVERSSMSEPVSITSTIAGLTQQELSLLVKNLPGNKGIRTSEPGYLQVEFEQPIICRSISLRSLTLPFQGNRMELFVSDDGRRFKSLGRLVVPKHGWADRIDIPCTHAIPEVKARVFRFVYDPATIDHRVPHYQESYDKAIADLVLSGLKISSAPAIHQFEGKAGYVWRKAEATTPSQAPDHLCVPLQSIVDLTHQVDATGRLQWKVPTGDWTILRVGYAPTGATNQTGGGAVGLECDKFNPAAIEKQLEGWFGKAVDATGSHRTDAHSLITHVDSWEAGSQNWSPVFLSEFRTRRGYDPTPYMPAMAGIPIESADVSERFLWDIRQTISELVSDKFYAAVHDFSRSHGSQFSAEAVAPVMIADGMMHQRHVDIPMGEFWWESTHNDKPTDCYEAISASHLHGRPLAQMEAFTTVATTWDEHPFLLKALGDHNFCMGANRFVLHVYTSQAWPDRVPGITLGRVGQFFTGHQTWWKAGKAWMEYLTRCQHLLQLGDFVADVCYFIGDESPRRALLPRDLNPTLPAGYNYDSVDPETLLHQFSVMDGRLQLPNGNGFAVLVLPPSPYMTPAILARLKELVADGITLVGSPPEKSAGLSGGADQSNQLVQDVANELWGNCDGLRVKEHRYKKGRVVFGRGLDEILAEQSVAADFLYSHASGIEYTHRHSPGQDLYFVSNQTSEIQRPVCSFRVKNGTPEFLLPESGETLRPAHVLTKGERTIVTLHLDPSESIFILFRETVQHLDPVKAIHRGGEAIPLISNPGYLRTGCYRTPQGDLIFQTTETGSYELELYSGRRIGCPVSTELTSLPLQGKWEVEFQAGRGAPSKIEMLELADWTQHTDLGVRYFSGTATYRISFHVPEGYMRADVALYLDLGTVGMLAEVRLNGQNLGVIWKPPYLIEVGAVLRMQNVLEVDISNVWKNRLIGDATLSPEKRITWFADDAVRIHPQLQADASLVASGLMGPVFLRQLSKTKLISPTA